MTSGLIYIAIIGMWVAYFAPRWIHDRNEFSGKSVERFKGALRVVANQSPHAAVSGGAINIDLDQEAKNRQTLLRRRITFLLIAFSLVTTVVGGAMNTMPFIYALVPASGLLIYIASVRRHVIGEQLQKRRVQQLNRQSSGVSNTIIKCKFSYNKFIGNNCPNYGPLNNFNWTFNYDLLKIE